MHLMPDFHPTGLGTIDGPAVLDRDAREVPSGPVERERFAGSKLRYIGQNTQASLARRVRERQRRAVILGLEGALVDSREASTLAWLVALHDGGHDVAIDLLRHLSGVAADELLRIVAGIRAESTEGKQIMRKQ